MVLSQEPKNPEISESSPERIAWRLKELKRSSPLLEEAWGIGQYKNAHFDFDWFNELMGETGEETLVADSSEWPLWIEQEEWTAPTIEEIIDMITSAPENISR